MNSVVGVESQLVSLFTLLSVGIVGLFIQFFEKAKVQQRAADVLKAELGALPREYTLIIMRPMQVFRFLSLALLFAGIVCMVAIASHLFSGPGPLVAPVVRWAIWVAAFSVTEIAIYQSSAISRILGSVKRRKWSRTVGWINAEWQLDLGPGVRTGGVDKIRCSHYARFIARALVKKSRSDFPRARRPNVADEEVACYLLVGCAFEVGMKRILAGGTDRTMAMWDALRHVAEGPSRPFRIANLEARPIGGGGLCKAVQSAAGSGYPDGLWDGRVESFVQIEEGVLRILRTAFASDARRIATDGFGPEPTLVGLAANLSLFPMYEEEVSREQFAKLASRMRVWSGLRREFTPPFSLPLAVHLLNAGCLWVRGDTAMLGEDPGFWALTAIAGKELGAQFEKCVQEELGESEHKILRKLWPTLGHGDIEGWDLRDLIDVYLWSQARDVCVRRTKERSGESLRCRLVVEGNACVCDLARPTWVMNGREIVRGD